MGSEDIETTKSLEYGEPQNRIVAHARSNRGRVREENQDRFLLDAVAGWGEHAPLVAMIADGMGGHQGGSQAAQIAVDTVFQTLTQMPPEVRLYEQLAASFTDADKAIRQRAAQDTQLTTMGTTGVAVVCFPGECVHLYVGDSRLYHFRDGAVTYRTRDHTVVRYLQEEGLLTADEARVHPMRSFLTSSLGGGNQERLALEPRWNDEGDSHNQPSILALQPGDVLLLCSDGLCGEVKEDQLLSWVEAYGKEPEKLTEVCVQGALEAGSRDNITVIAIAYIRTP